MLTQSLKALSRSNNKSNILLLSKLNFGNIQPQSPVKALINDEPHSNHSLPHPVWNLKEIEKVEITHVAPKDNIDKIAYYSVQFVRKWFDLVTGYSFGIKGEGPWLRRVVFLETIAGIPGMVGAMIRHLSSLRHMKRDHGWIHTLLEEAENERMHLMIALLIKGRPGFLVHSTVVLSQGIVFPVYALLYAISPRFCHRFVGYLEEEATRTYTHLISEIDDGKLPLFKESANEFARDYYGLGPDATNRDIFLCMRADETHHRDTNHALTDIGLSNDPNPFKPGH